MGSESKFSWPKFAGYFILMGGLFATLFCWGFIWLANTFGDFGLPPYGEAFFPWCLGIGVLTGLLMGILGGIGKLDDA